MGYGNEVTLLELQNDETRNKLKLSLKLYGFDLTTEDLEKLLTVDEQPLMYDNKLSGYSNEQVQLIAVKKIFMNTRGSLKLVIWKNGKFSIFNRDAKPASMPRINIPYNYQGNEIWDDIKEGFYVAFSHVYWQHQLEVGELTDCKTRKQAEEWLELYTYCCKKVEEFNSYEEMSDAKGLEGKGIIPRKALVDWKSEIEKTIIQIQQLENQEAVLRATALKTQISIVGAKLALRGLDGHTYEIETPAVGQWKDEEWIEYVYKHRYQWKQRDQEAIKEETLFKHVMEKLITAKLDWFKLSVDGKTQAKVSIKTIVNKKQSEVTIAYLNDRRVAFDDMHKALYEYFMKGQTLTNPAEEPEDVDEAQKQKALEVRKQRDEAIVTTGITGSIQDLEGEVPITIGFEKKGANWLLVIGEKKLPLKGGVETIKSLENVLKGTAQGYHARHSTEELYQRLCKILDPEQAIEVISTAKEMGKLLKALEVKNKQ